MKMSAKIGNSIKTSIKNHKISTIYAQLYILVETNINIETIFL